MTEHISFCASVAELLDVSVHYQFPFCVMIDIRQKGSCIQYMYAVLIVSGKIKSLLTINNGGIKLPHPGRNFAISKPNRRLLVTPLLTIPCCKQQLAFIFLFPRLLLRFLPRCLNTYSDKVFSFIF